MKQKLLLLAMGLFAAMGTIKADNVYFTTSEVDVMQGKQAKVTMRYDADGSHEYMGFQVEFFLPDSVHLVATELGPEIAANNPAMTLEFSDRRPSDNKSVLLGFQIALTPMPVGEGIELCSFYLEAKDWCDLGEYLIETTKIEFACEPKTTFDSQSFTLNVIPYAARVLEDTDTDVPVASVAPEDVIVKRTIKKWNWSTICLPFSLTGDQLKEIFGDHVEVADFVKTDLADNVLKVYFEYKDVNEGLEANRPYCLYSHNAMSEFKVKDVMVAPDEEAAHIYVDNGKSGRQRVDYGIFHGILKKGDYTPEEEGNCVLYLKDNKFYYNEQQIWMNAFRGYFEFYDFTPELADIVGDKTEDQAVNNVIFVIDGEETAIEGVSIKTRATGDVYNVNGMYMGRAEDVMSTLPRGIYVINNKKVVVK